MMRTSPPNDRAVRSAPTNTPRALESMNVTSRRSMRMCGASACPTTSATLSRTSDAVSVSNSPDSARTLQLLSSVVVRVRSIAPETNGEHQSRGATVGGVGSAVLSPEPQLLQRPRQQPGHLHLADAEPRPDLGLGQPLD